MSDIFLFCTGLQSVNQIAGHIADSIWMSFVLDFYLKKRRIGDSLSLEQVRSVDTVTKK